MLVESELARERIRRGRQSRLLVIIANELARHGMISMLRSIPTIGEVVACGGPDEALEMLATYRPDVVVCHANGDAAASVCPVADVHGARVLLLLEDLDLDTLDETVTMAAHGFMIQDDATVDSLAEAVARLVRGEMSMPAGLARALIGKARDTFEGRGASNVLLTSREQQVLSLVAHGLSNKQIGRRIGISEHGVKRHVTNVLAKLNSPNRTFAVALALREGLIPPPA